MKSLERTSMWHHTLFSALICLAMVVLYWFRRDTPSLIIIAFVALYVVGNTLIHLRRKDFRKETLYEYLLVSAAVLIVLLGAVQK